MKSKKSKTEKNEDNNNTEILFAYYFAVGMEVSGLS